MTNHANQNIPERQSTAPNEDRFKALVAATSDVIYNLSADWRVMRELDGRGFLKDAHAPTDEWQDRNIHPDHMEMARNAIDDAIRNKKMFELEHKVWRADGTPGWTYSRAIPIMDDKGEIIEWFGVASDITDRKLAEEGLRESREIIEKQKRLYEAINSATPDLIYVFDLDYKFTYANKALLTMWGKTWENAIGKGLLANGYEPWHAEMHEREIDRVRDTKQPIRGEVSFPHAVLGRRVYDYIFTPVINELGEVEAVAGTTRDITERKQWELKLANSTEELQVINEELAAANEEQAAYNEELTTTNDELAIVNQQLLAAQQKIDESETALRLAIEAADFGTWFIHSETREFITDARLKELFGYYPDEPLSIEQALAQITEEYRGFVANKLENAIYNGGDYDVTYPVIGLHDRQLRWLRAIGNLKADPSGAFSAFTGVVMDITEQYLAAKKIERAEQSMRMAIDASHSGTYSINSYTLEFTASSRLKELFGFNADEDMPYEACMQQIREDYRPAAYSMVEAALTKGERFELEYPVIGFHDGKQRWLRGIGTLEKDSNGIDSFFAGITIDITEQKENEQRKNDFIGMVSHELKTPLTSLTLMLQMLDLKLLGHEDVFIPDVLEKAGNQIRKMNGLINGFLNVSRLESAQIHLVKSTFDLGKLLSDTVEETRLTTHSHQLVLNPAEAWVNADREKISSVISNLLSNAIKYSTQQTAITISIRPEEKRVVVSVADRGVGIKQEDVEKIFERYYRIEDQRTKFISGFGIGLYLSSEIIRLHEGKIWVESEVGIGSTFNFSLPANAEE